MRSLALVAVAIALCTAAAAQQYHFLFVQSESRTPFNITLNKKVYSSTGTGYVIIPKLVTGTYPIAIGFGGDSLPDQQFEINIAQKDVGYTLKKFSEKGWGLFNLQTYDVVYAVNKTTQSTAGQANTLPKADKAFQPVIGGDAKTETSVATQPAGNNRPAPIADTPLVSQPSETINPQPQQNAPRPTTPQGQQPTGTPQSQPSNTPAVDISAANGGATGAAGGRSGQRGSVIKISELKGSEAHYLTYVDQSFQRPDTINLLIPYTKAVNNKPATPAPAAGEGLKFLEIETSNPQPAKSAEVPAEWRQDSRQQPASTEAVTKPPAANHASTGGDAVANTDNQPALNGATGQKAASAGNARPEQPNMPAGNAAPATGQAVQAAARCATPATDDEYFQLRKKMVSAPNSTGMLDEARSAFKLRCFTTQQVKNLASMFFSDAGRYQFLEAAYPAVTDPGQFAALAVLLTDSYYVGRFNALFK